MAELAGTAAASKKKRFGTRVKRDFLRNNQLYLLILPVLAYYAIFAYGPLFGIIISFQNYSPARGVLHSQWVGLSNFADFFNSVYCARVITNVLVLNGLWYIFAFPAPIILALLLNEVKTAFGTVVQTVSSLPYFMSLVVVCGMVIQFTSKGGFILDIVKSLGGKDQSMLQRPELFRPIYIVTTIWITVGWSSIIYTAALSAVDTALYEAAHIDGANRWQQMLHVTLPGIAPTIVILLIMALGTLMGSNLEKVLLLYNPSIYSTADVISTYIYRSGLLQMRFGYAAAVDVFNSVTNLAALVLSNFVSRKVTAHSLW